MLATKNKKQNTRIINEFFKVLKSKINATLSWSLFFETFIAEIFPKPKFRMGAMKLKKCKKI